MRDMKSAPRDGTEITLKTPDGREFLACWQGGLLNIEGEEVGGWHATTGNHPPCWHDGICWDSNADEQASLQPVAWKP